MCMPKYLRRCSRSFGKFSLIYSKCQFVMHLVEFFRIYLKILFWVKGETMSLKMYSRLYFEMRRDIKMINEWAVRIWIRLVYMLICRQGNMSKHVINKLLTSNIFNTTFFAKTLFVKIFWIIINKKNYFY